MSFRALPQSAASKQTAEQALATPILDNYPNIRSAFQARMDSGYSAMPASPGSMLSDPHGLFIQGARNFLTERIAGVDKMFYVWVNNIITDPDFALRKDPQIYKRMMRDPQIYYCIEVRKRATVSLPWVIVPPEKYAADPGAVLLAQQAEERLRRMPRVPEFLSKLMDALLPGLSVVELVWHPNPDGTYRIVRTFPIRKDRIVFDINGNPRLLTRSNPVWGEYLPDYKFITHTHNIDDGWWNSPEEAGYCYYGRGLADTPLYHYFYFKMIALRYLMKALEIHGLPTKIYYTGPQNAPLAAQLDQILAALANDSVVGIPGKKGDTNVDTIQGSNSAAMFIGFIEYVDRLITRAILGQELMTEMPVVGSYAAAQVHQQVFSRIAEDDRTQLEDTLNRTLMRYDAELNTPQIPEEARPIFKFKSQPLVDAAGYLNVVQQAIQLGLPVSEPQVRELSGLREPREGEQVMSLASIAAAHMQASMYYPKPEAGTNGAGASTTTPHSRNGNGNGNGNPEEVAAAAAHRGSKRAEKNKRRYE